ncbi:MAG: hypothetical protein IIB42_09195 [Candidatus Marinimicrobia bacterium]|nr:hypothetical protein [Candidatus Neomarinimicrobiota bacterium]
MMEEQRTRRQYTREFKMEAVELLINGNRKAVEVAPHWGNLPDFQLLNFTSTLFTYYYPVSLDLK